MFQKEAARRLPFGLGSAYAEVMRKCPTGRFDVPPGEEYMGLSQGEYQNQVRNLDQLRVVWRMMTITMLQIVEVFEKSRSQF